MKPIIQEFDLPIQLRHLLDEDAENEHHSLETAITYSAIHAIGLGSGFFRLGTTEGEISFVTSAGKSYDESTSLVSGADGATTYLKVTASYTATAATVIADVELWGTRVNRTQSNRFSIEAGVNQSLAGSQTYIVNWTLHADI